MKCYLSFYLGERDAITIETFGWSESKYMAKSFLETFEYIDRDIYTPILIDVNISNKNAIKKYIAEYCGSYLADNPEDTRIKTFMARDNSRGIISTKHMLYTWKLGIQEEPDMIAYQGDIFREKTSYNLLWMMSDLCFIKNEQISDILKSTIEIVYRRYTTCDLLSKGRIDFIKYWIYTGYLKGME